MRRKRHVNSDVFPEISVLFPIVEYYFSLRRNVKRAVSMRRLFQDVYGREYLSSVRRRYGDLYKMTVLKRTIQYCRKLQSPFIVPTEVDGEVRYFCPRTPKDAAHYIEILNKAQRGMEETIKYRLPLWFKTQEERIKDIKKRNRRSKQ